MTQAEKKLSRVEWRRAGKRAVAAAHRGAKGSKQLTYLDFAVLDELAEWIDADGLCFRSYRDLADGCGCSVTAVRSAIARLIAASLVEVPVGVRKTIRKGGLKLSDKGRPATTYRAIMPDNFCKQDCTNSEGISASAVAENEAGREGILCKRGCTTLCNRACTHRDTIREGEKRLSASPPINDSSESDFTSSVATVEEAGSGARYRARPSAPDWNDFDGEDAAILAQLGKPVTLDELDRLTATDPGPSLCDWPDPEAGDEPAEPGADPIDWPEAIAAFEEMHGTRLPDGTGYVESLIFGFLAGDRIARREAIEQTVQVLRGIGRPDMRDPTWRWHCTILHGLFSGEDQIAADDALDHFEREVREAWHENQQARETRQ